MVSRTRRHEKLEWQHWAEQDFKTNVLTTFPPQYERHAHRYIHEAQESKELLHDAYSSFMRSRQESSDLVYGIPMIVLNYSHLAPLRVFGSR
jgi:hypothetical protein